MTTFLRHQLWPAFALLLALTLITGVVYPAVVTARRPGRLPVPGQRLVHRTVDGRTVGSSLIGQAFSDAEVLLGPPVRRRRRRLRRATRSAGSNLGPTNQALIDRIAADVDRLRAANGDGPVPVDLVTTSASGSRPATSARPRPSTRSPGSPRRAA